MTRYYGCALIAAFVTTGCQIPPTQDLLEVSVVDQGPAQIDVGCGLGCPSETLALEVEFKPHALLDDQAAVELVQYRVDYELTGVQEPVPYFAAYTDQVIPFGEISTFSVDLVGDVQRAWILPRLGGNVLSGTAIVTFGGYDHKNTQVKLQTEEVELRFGSFN